MANDLDKLINGLRGKIVFFVGVRCSTSCVNDFRVLYVSLNTL